MKQTKLKKSQNRMPEDYYLGDLPNPNLSLFVKKNLDTDPFDLEKDDYNIRAFAKPIKTTKATAIYNMHTYWSKKPHTAITQYINHYTKPGDLVLDPMCGSGGTALAALMEGRKAIAIDLSPAATFITKNYCTPVDADDLREAFEQLMKEVKVEIDWLYETRCDQCGGTAITQFTVYSQRYQCPRCLEIIPLFDCITTKIPAKTQQKGKPLKMKEVNVCPYCKEKGHLENISTRSKRFGAIPVLASYKCLGKCQPKQRQRLLNDVNKNKREYFKKYDLSKIEEITKKEIPYWYPSHRMMNVTSDTDPWGDEWRPGRNFRTVAELFTKRNLWVLSIIFDGIKNLKASDDIKDWLKFGLTGIILGLSKMNRYRPDVSYPLNIMNGTYYLPPISKEEYILKHYKNKIKRLITGLQAITSHSISNEIMISTDDATNSMKSLPRNCVDYVFTDPPYGGKVQYGELNFVWESWLDFDTTWHEKEIIVNETRGKSNSDWEEMLTQVAKQAYRIIKPGRWLSLCYHDTSEGSWQRVHDIMTKVGFIPQQSDSAMYIDTGGKTFNQSQSNKVTKRDLVIHFRKPKPGETSSLILLNSNEGATTFIKKASSIIREFLLENPGTTKDRIYDELVSHMVPRGQMQAHDFDSILKIIAEPVNNISLSHSGKKWLARVNVERWYIKNSEIYENDVAESAKEEASACIMGEFIQKYLKDNPECEGIHYSDLFEHYIYAIKDKPRRELRDWVLDYFFVTNEGTYRLPVTEEEKKFKEDGRKKGLNRQIKRFIAYINNNVPIPKHESPDNLTLVNWILHARRTSLYFEGKVLFEKAGLNLNDLPETTKVELEEAYQTCTRLLNKA